MHTPRKSCSSVTQTAHAHHLTHTHMHTQEDAHVVHLDIDGHGTALFAVFDGHSGREVSAFCAQHFVSCSKCCLGSGTSCPYVRVPSSWLWLECNNQGSISTPSTPGRLPSTSVRRPCVAQPTHGPTATCDMHASPCRWRSCWRPPPSARGTWAGGCVTPSWRSTAAWPTRTAGRSWRRTRKGEQGQLSMRVKSTVVTQHC